MIEGLTARQIIEMIANEYYELSHDKIKLQRDDHVRWCKQWLELNPVIETPLEQIRRWWQSKCNGFCGEYECKENQANCKRIKR
jgi:hypothetical protein